MGAMTYSKDIHHSHCCISVDDVLIGGSKPGLFKRLKKTLMDRFSMTDMDEVSLILSMNVTRLCGEGTVTTTQKE